MRGTSWLVTLRRGGESEGRKMKKKEKKNWGKKIPTAFFSSPFSSSRLLPLPRFLPPIGQEKVDREDDRGHLNIVVMK